MKPKKMKHLIALSDEMSLPDNVPEEAALAIKRCIFCDQLLNQWPRHLMVAAMNEEIEVTALYACCPECVPSVQADSEGRMADADRKARRCFIDRANDERCSFLFRNEDGLNAYVGKDAPHQE